TNRTQKDYPISQSNTTDQAKCAHPKITLSTWLWLFKIWCLLSNNPEKIKLRASTFECRYFVLPLIISSIRLLTGLPIHFTTWSVFLSRPFAHHHFQTTVTIKTSKCKRKKERKQSQLCSLSDHSQSIHRAGGLINSNF